MSDGWVRSAEKYLLDRPRLAATIVFLVGALLTWPLVEGLSMVERSYIQKQVDDAVRRECGR